MSLFRRKNKTIVPFANNSGKPDIRMTKIQQKNLGLPSLVGRCRYLLSYPRSYNYLSSCQKSNVTASAALSLLYRGGSIPVFMSDKASRL